MRKMRGIILMLVVALVMAACADDDAGTTTTEGESGATTTTAAPMETESMVFAISNLRSIQYFPVYLADAGGFFEEEGIEWG